MNADESWKAIVEAEEKKPQESATNLGWKDKPTKAEETKIVSRDLTATEKEELHTLNYELVQAESPRDVVMSETMRPRSQKGAGNIKAIAVSFRTIRYSYDYIIKQPVNLTLCANALLTFAIDRLHELKKQVQIQTEQLSYQLIDATGKPCQQLATGQLFNDLFDKEKNIAHNLVDADGNVVYQVNHVEDPESKTEYQLIDNNGKVAYEVVQDDKLAYKLIDAESPRDLVCSDSMRPRSKKTSSDKDAVQIGFKADAGVYDWLIKQPVNMALCGNALLQFAIDTLRAENKQVKILSNKGKR